MCSHEGTTHTCSVCMYHRYAYTTQTDTEKEGDRQTDREAVDNVLLQLRHVYVHGHYIQYMHTPHIYAQRDVDVIQIKQT